MAAKSGIFKPVLITVLGSVLTSVILYLIGLEDGPASKKDSGPTAITHEELQLQKQELERMRREMQLVIDGQSSSQAVTQNTVPPRNLTGNWTDPNTGAAYTIQQNGQHFTFSEYSWGTATATGKGQINPDGQSAHFTFTNLIGNMGRGQMTFAANNSALYLTLTDALTQRQFQITLVRQ